MDENPGLPLIHLVRDYYMNTFTNYSLGDLSQEDKFTLFYLSMMGILYQYLLSNQNEYIVGLIKEAESLNAIDGIIRLGYEQASGSSF